MQKKSLPQDDVDGNSLWKILEGIGQFHQEKYTEGD